MKHGLPNPPAPTTHSLTQRTGLLWGLPVRGVTRDVSFCVWLLSLRTVTSGSVHVMAGGRTSFLPEAGSHSGVWTDHTVFTLHLSVDTQWFPSCGHRGRCCWCATTGVQVYVQVPAFRPFRLIPRSGISGSYGNFIFNLLEEASQCFPRRLHRFLFPPAGHEVPVSPRRHQPGYFYCCLFVFIITILRGVRCYLTVALT